MFCLAYLIIAIREPYSSDYIDVASQNEAILVSCMVRMLDPQRRRNLLEVLLDGGGFKIPEASHRKRRAERLTQAVVNKRVSAMSDISLQRSTGVPSAGSRSFDFGTLASEKASCSQRMADLEAAAKLFNADLEGLKSMVKELREEMNTIAHIQAKSNPTTHAPQSDPGFALEMLLTSRKT